MESTINQPENKQTSFFPIVAIGASAGGIKAFQELLSNLPKEPGMAFIYVQHSNPDHESQLVNIFSRFTSMKVVEAEEGMQLEEDHLYVSPSTMELTIIKNKLKLTPHNREGVVHNSINNFFFSLAENLLSPTIGIILSGAATDGVNGLKALKAAGGLTFAQGDSAEFSSMPLGAVDEGAIDLILSPKEMAEELKRISTQKEVFYSAIKDLNEDNINNRDHHLLSILQLIHKSVGVDFRLYKMNTIKRRIIRRMMLHKLDNIGAYANYLRQHTAEVNLLYQDLLINVTTFFRDEESMKYLKESLLPEVLNQKGENDPIRIWVPACSTGQEAYSLAMLMVEVLGDRIASVPVQIFATDLSETVINKARVGIYSKDDIGELNPKRLQRFFTKTEGNFRIVKHIRDMCVFATHNVAKDPPFSRIDLVSCCNLLIYLDPVLQRKIMATFHYALNTNGYLILGKSETASTATNLFVPIDKKVKIYAKKKDVNARAVFEMNFVSPELRIADEGFERRIQPKNISAETDMEKALDKLLLSKYVPASVLVNGDLDILQFRGATSLFLEPSPGRASLNLLKMARSGLGFELRNVVHKAKSSGETARKENLDLQYLGKNYNVTIEAVPVSSNSEEQFFLVVFYHEPVNENNVRKIGEQDDARVRQLEKELHALREDMKAIVEAQEAANEELQSANEEIVSSNEELQSINEELETSKEELESSNEELITINQELQVRNAQLSETQEYAEAIFSTIRESLVVLDSNMRIRSTNPAFYETFKLKNEEIEGKQLFDLSHGQWNITELRDYPYATQSKKIKDTILELRHSFPIVGEKVFLFNSCTVVRKSPNEEIMLLAIEDITEHRLAQRMISEREDWLRNMANNAPVMMWVSGTDKLNSFVNKAYLDYRGITLEHAVGKLWFTHVHPEDLEACRKEYEKSFELKRPFKIEYRLLRHDGVYRWILDHAQPNFTLEGQFSGFIGSCMDVHDQRMTKIELEKRIEERTLALLHTNNELERSHSELQQFAYVASHDLQEPLRKIMTFLDRMEEEGAGKFSDDRMRYFRKVNDTTQHMTRLLDDLLNFSRISRLNKRFINTDLNEILQNVLSDLDEMVRQKGASVMAIVLPSIQAIPLQIAQLFHHLIHNSLMFSSLDKIPVVQVMSRPVEKDVLKGYPQLDQDLDYTEIIFRDNGIGFSPEYAEQIFGIFQRLNSKGEFTGSGIGLSLCRKIVNNHNGYIFASGKEGEGAEFHIILPIEQRAD